MRRPAARSRPLQQALAAAGAELADVALVVNCHLHFDHCGGNPLVAGKPILVQDVELATARRGRYTVDELVDFPGVTYQELDGEEPPLPAYRPWLERLADFDPRRVLFAHDCSVWEPSDGRGTE